MFAGGDAPKVNSRGDTFNASTLNRRGFGTYDNPIGAIRATGNAGNGPEAVSMFINWLTAGGPGSQVDPGTIFKNAEDVAPQEVQAAKGAGLSGLFGNGPLINAIQPIKPLNQGPLQGGVPSLPAIPSVPGIGK